MPQISASVDSKTIVKVNKLAEDQSRSFSEMVNILLTQAVSQLPSRPKKKLSPIK